ncbi:MAG TPA: hypothetical protein VFU38_10930 [Candidatus Krumholzibacteria bacterium]|nr:hypothetical protein [Candidatus Krumholzibacteria bacterium]
MSTKRYSLILRSAAVLAVAGLVAAVISQRAVGETVRLKDGSTLKGRLVRVDGDTLTVRLAIGAPVKVHRAQVESILFTDSLAVPAVSKPMVAAPPPATAGTGTIAVKFEDRKVSSKITIEKRKDWDHKVRSNHILVEFVVDGAVIYTAADTTMDKTVYRGDEKDLKNDAKLEDFAVQVPAGRHACTLLVRNRDPDTFYESFDPEPLTTVLEFGEVTVENGAVVRLDIKMDKGLLRMSSPRLYHANSKKD